jgi:hypothetical protein
MRFTTRYYKDSISTRLQHRGTNQHPQQWERDTYLEHRATYLKRKEQQVTKKKLKHKTGTVARIPNQSQRKQTENTTRAPISIHNNGIKDTYLLKPPRKMLKQQRAEDTI